MAILEPASAAPSSSYLITIDKSRVFDRSTAISEFQVVGPGLDARIIQSYNNRSLLSAAAEEQLVGRIPNNQFAQAFGCAYRDSLPSSAAAARLRFSTTAINAYERAIRFVSTSHALPSIM